MDNQDHIAPLPRVAIQAFCETPDIKSALLALPSDRRMVKAMLKVQDGGISACLEAYRGAPTPNIIIVEANADRNGLLVRLDELAQYCDAGTRVVVIGHANDVHLYRDLMRRGVSEYLIAPVNSVDLVAALSGIYTAEGSGTVGRAVAVYGAKGGVGASTVAHNLAFHIATRLQLATTIIDFDLPFGTAGLNFNQDPPQGIAEAVFAPDRLDMNVVDRLTSKCAENLSILSAPATLDRTYDFRETDFDALIDILRSTTPMIVYDLPHVWNAWTRRALVGADEIVIVAVPDLANLRNTKTLLDTLRQARPNDKPPHVMLNLVGVPKRPEIGVAEFAKALDVELAAALPFDPAHFGAAANNGQMLSEVANKSKTVEMIMELAGRVTGRAEGKVGRKSILEPLLSRIGIKAA
ncbi:MAG: AAA family ATPase [Beijerinckiaceae bacterium]